MEKISEEADKEPTNAWWLTTPMDFFNDLSDSDFSEDLLLNKEAMKELAEKLEPKLTALRHRQDCQLTNMQMVVATVMWLASATKYRILSYTTHIPLHSLVGIITDVTLMIAELQGIYVLHPDQDSIHKMEAGFYYYIKKLPQCLAVVGRTHVKVNPGSGKDILLIKSSFGTLLLFRLDFQ